ncbi:MAG: hypothetical protein RMK84_06925 [Oscillochloridaceae bacterium]|nr:hypothetical protein [Chloroflexaceae bacterium]MDW8389842.1 hypothetical protein [Oscillochloridaceae bacterium]
MEAVQELLALEEWSYANLGQWHYVLGYAIVLVSHNWPIMLALALSGWFGLRAYVQPTRLNVSWLLTGLLFGLLYEYAKHIARELHAAIDFLFGLEIANLNRPLHFLVGPAAIIILQLSFLAMLAQSLRLSLAARRARKRDSITQGPIHSQGS